MGVGRKPKPTAIKKLTGNPGRRPFSKNEAHPDIAIPEAPDFLNDEGKLEWARITEELATAGLITRMDMAAIAAYCQSYGRWSHAEKQLQKAGSYIYKTPAGAWQTLPFLWVANKEREFLHKFLVEFGMTPSSRTRAHAIPPKPKEQRKKLAKLMVLRKKIDKQPAE